MDPQPKSSRHGWEACMDKHLTTSREVKYDKNSTKDN